MTVNVTRTLRVALATLQAERARIDRQIAAIGSVLDSSAPRRGRRGRRGPRRRAEAGRRRLNAAARRAIARRMKAYWAKRKATSAKTMGKKGRRAT